MTTPLESTPLAAVALTATRYSKWVRSNGLYELAFQVGSVGTGSPVGVWSFQGSNDPVISTEHQVEVLTGTAIGASSVAETFAMPTDDVIGDSLSITGSSATKSYIAWDAGLPRYVRAVFTYGSGGSAASLGHVYASGR